VKRVAIVTSWASRCGIAEYTRSLVLAVPAGRFEFFVLADHEVDFTDKSGLLVERCWQKTGDDVTGILEAVQRLAIDLVVVEFNWGYLNPRPLRTLLTGIRAAGVPVVVQMHSTDDRVIDGIPQSLSDLAFELSAARALVVHSDADERRMQQLAPGAPIERALLGQDSYPDESASAVRAALGIETHTPVLASFGFLFPHKGVLETIQALPLMQSDWPEMAFLAVCSVIPSMLVSVMHWRRCQLEIRRLDLAGSVALITDFLAPEAAMTLLHAADVIVLPYVETFESASAAARFALSSRRPMVTTSSPIFDLLGDAVFRIPDASPEAIATGVKRVLEDQALRADLLLAASEASAAADWSVAGVCFADMLDRALVTPA